MESGEITSDQIIASSEYNPSWSPERSRLNYYENAWTPAEDSNKEWIQVKFIINPYTTSIAGGKWDIRNAPQTLAQTLSSVPPFKREQKIA